MNGIEASLEGLEPVALLQRLRHVQVRGRLASPFEPGRRRQVFGRAHVRPDHSPRLLRRIRRDPHLVFELVLRQLVGHLHARALEVELPAVEHAPQAVLLVASEPQRRPSVRTKFVHQPDASASVTERHEILAQDPHPRGGTVRFRQLPRQQHRLPVPPHQGTHRGAGSHSSDRFVVNLRQHARTSVRGTRSRAPPRVGIAPGAFPFDSRFFERSVEKADAGSPEVVRPTRPRATPSWRSRSTRWSAGRSGGRIRPSALRPQRNCISAVSARAFC